MADRQSDAPQDIAIIGAGSYGVVIAELAESCGYRVTYFLDDDPAKQGGTLDGVPVLGSIADGLETLPRDVSVAVAIGDNDVRLAWLREAQRLGHQTPRLVSPQAMVSPSAQLEPAVYLHPGCHVWTRARIGLGSILSPHASVVHHAVLDEGCFVSGGALVGASVAVGVAAFFGQGSTTSTGVRSIGEHTLVGAGAVIIRDTEPYGVYVGNPARLLRLQGGHK